MSKTPISKSQQRAMRLLGLTAVDSYDDAAAALENARAYPGYERDGVPAGHTWRTAAKLTDAELIEALGVEREEGFVVRDQIQIAEGGY